MKKHLLLVLTSALVSNLSWGESPLIPEQILAPDRSHLLEINGGIRVLDSSGSSVVTLASNLEGVQQVEAKWSADSGLVFVIISYARGSGVEAAYFDASGWHKTLQAETDLPVDELARQSGVSGRLVAQHCRLGQWLDQQRIAVTGDLIFSGQRKVAYEYTLAFTRGPVHLDRGGFEEGAIKGVGYHVR
jgi:hypothetical protein